MSFEVRRAASFGSWLESLSDDVARRAINARLARLRRGLFGDRHGVGEKVGELRIDVGQGYRVYFTMGGPGLILLLCGGTKSSQRADIRKAHRMAKAVAAQRAKEAGSGRVEERRPAYAAETGEPALTEDDLIFAPFDAADYLEDDDSQIHLLRDAFSTGHPGYIADAIDAVARARARRGTAIKRQTLNKSPSLKGNPTLETLLTVLKALGLRLEMVEDRGGGPADAPTSRTR